MSDNIAPSIRSLWYDCLSWCCCCDQARIPRIKSGRSHILKDDSIVDRQPKPYSRKNSANSEVELKSDKNVKNDKKLTPKTRRLTSKSSWFDSSQPLPMDKINKGRLRSASILSFAASPSERRSSLFSLGMHSTAKIGVNDEVDDRYLNAALEIE